MVFKGYGTHHGEGLCSMMGCLVTWVGAEPRLQILFLTHSPWVGEKGRLQKEHVSSQMLTLAALMWEAFIKSFCVMRTA